MVRYWAHNPGTDNACASSTLAPATKNQTKDNYMKKLIISILAATVIAGAYCSKATAFKSGEYIDAQRNVKVCVYQAFGKNYTYAVATYNICPVSIEICTN